MFETSRKLATTFFLLFLTIAVSAVSARGQNSSILYDFGGYGDGMLPVTGLLERNGVLYGTTQEGGSSNVDGAAGTVFALDLNSGQKTELHTFGGGFQGPDGAFPSSKLIADGKGNLYGTTIGGGNFTGICLNEGCGIIFKISLSGTETILYTFAGGTDGFSPNEIVLDKAGNLYGTTEWGGHSGQCCGTVFKLASNGTLTTLYSFKGGSDGEAPSGDLTLDKSGNLYGATRYGGNLSDCITSFFPAGCGVLFKIATTGQETVLYTFTGGADGAVPNGGLLLDSSGNLYGTASSGGRSSCNGFGAYPGCGVIFELDSSGTEKVLYTFHGSAKGDGANPNEALVSDGAGNLFGTTYHGGAANDGAVFQWNANGLTLLHSFDKNVDGWLPWGGMIRDAKGNLYGTIGGDNSGCPFYYFDGACGAVFQVVAPPQIAKFAPASGPVGTTVSIVGISLSQTTEVTFNGVVATFAAKSDRLVTAIVPSGATTGKIAITSPGGSAASSLAFTVTK